MLVLNFSLSELYCYVYIYSYKHTGYSGEPFIKITMARDMINYNERKNVQGRIKTFIVFQSSLDNSLLMIIYTYRKNI